ncbi:MAG: hypothetical protein AUJ92_01585 [Armatimonadetes bacterium CG2_30_59_28]|nr:small basic family protein [Armatimonadota bacterium]OIO98339.1 MAG: hypothetical protein AUJ92_01585 [Armatimonadetes bacterium CG2_30_59_28]PIU61299.1 MAG: DUF1290 domain-containing protein [Armatimonadetes bacterium CG07_land_8_20_14_0_80_59_28]PIX44108.1 MAG: DUF1290 domain-containing protein [Armatimonadetes bacterium CG_4_8_14_3_um_filter_58_9]PIY41537.1 MAG: DUF1290 domain-containing protein [Armatimonadetes bacterium CG_4_10_14_3_um_filter_59_10]PJB77215.1 MAG: DUF1290 domain-contai
MWLPVVALIVGFTIAYVSKVTLPLDSARYVAIGILASLDTVVGGMRARIEGRYDNTIFISGFYSNTVLGVGLVYVGDLLSVNFEIAAEVVFGVRIFQNLAGIRHGLLDKRLHRRSSEHTALESPAHEQQPAE